GYDANPLRDGSLDAYQVHAVPLTSMTVAALQDLEGVTAREAERSKNMFALGLMSWLYGRPTETTIAFLEAKFAKRPEIVAANVKAFKTGYAFGETSESFAVQYVVKPARLEPGRYRQITGNQALSYGLIAASTPGDCFHAAIEAARVAFKYRTPVYLLSDAYLANGAEPWLIPDVSALPRIAVDFAEPSDGEFLPYARDPETLARPWAIPGT